MTMDYDLMNNPGLALGRPIAVLPSLGEDSSEFGRLSSREFPRRDGLAFSRVPLASRRPPVPDRKRSLSNTNGPSNVSDRPACTHPTI